MSILADGIFMNPRYDQYEDYGETQSYYDLRTGIIYLRIKAAMYKAYFFRNSILAEKLEKQSEENRDALIGEFDGFLYASWRANAVYRTLENMCDEGLLTEKEYRECKV